MDAADLASKPSTKSKSRERLSKGTSPSSLPVLYIGQLSLTLSCVGHSVDKENEGSLPSQSCRRLAAAGFAAPSMYGNGLDDEDTPLLPAVSRGYSFTLASTHHVHQYERAHSTPHKHAQDTPSNKSKITKSGKAMQQRHDCDGEESEVEAELDKEEEGGKEARDDEDETDSGESSESDDPVRSHSCVRVLSPAHLAYHRDLISVPTMTMPTLTLTKTSLASTSRPRALMTTIIVRSAGRVRDQRVTPPALRPAHNCEPTPPILSLHRRTLAL